MTGQIEQPRRWSLWLAHYQVAVTLATAATAALIVGASFVPHAVATALGVGAIIGIVGVDFACYRHRAALCERCAADMPINGAEVAQKRRRLLWWHHASGWRLLVLLAVTLGPGSELVRGVVLATALVVAAVADGAHLTVSLWCPWCRGGRGWDDHEDAPTPTPDPTVEASR